MVRAATSAGTLLMALAAAGVPLHSAAAQEPLRHRCPDGTRFLLVAHRTAPLVHWVVLERSGPLFDPGDHPGLTRATIRASFNGTPTIGSLDWFREEQALDRLDEMALKLDAVRATEGADVAAAEQSFGEALMETRRTGDPFAWRRQLEVVPVRGPETSEVDGATLLRFTCEASRLRALAELLLERRGACLRGLHDLYRDAARRAGWRARDLRARMRQQVLELAIPDAGTKRESATGLRQAGLRLLRELQSGPNQLNVLYGNFDTAKARAMLDEVFTSLEPGTDAAPTAVAEPGPSDRRSVPSTSRGGVTLAVPIPADADPDAVALLVDWLLVGEDGALARALRARGIADVQVDGLAPFLAPEQPLFLVEALQAPASPRVLRAERLERILLEEIARLAAAGPDEEEWENLVRRARGRSAREQSDPGRLAEALALAEVMRMRTPEQVLSRPRIQVDRGQVRDLATSLFGATVPYTVRAEPPL